MHENTCLLSKRQSHERKLLVVWEKGSIKVFKVIRSDERLPELRFHGDKGTRPVLSIIHDHLGHSDPIVPAINDGNFCISI